MQEGRWWWWWWKPWEAWESNLLCFPRAPGQVLDGARQRMEVATDDGVDEDARVLPSIPCRHVHHVRLHHHRAVVPLRVEAGHRTVVGEAVLPADHPEAEHVTFVVQDLQALAAGGRRQAGHDADLPQRPDVAVAVDHVAALHEVLVGLRLVEAPNHRPHCGNRRRDVLHQGRAALVGPNRVLVVSRSHVRYAMAYAPHRGADGGGHRRPRLAADAVQRRGRLGRGVRHRSCLKKDDDIRVL
ncbi:unnamed protein product [Musa acuminata subsp. malaccensis]|uniref:(wild Malaysian banana) hypothetical protein n=1 Tax=Musa acuminata subsp. malaccensis TaxID=214687 RepID=A0A8D7A3X8_MUSAM|nr:unnamed protein product [Musa acuminata subsp. malaccensis]